MTKISIRAPREGSDALGVPIRPVTAQFLSALPAWGATWMAASASPASSPFLSALPARGATLPRPYPHPLGDISIRAPREGSDNAHLFFICASFEFLSALPAWGATEAYQAMCEQYGEFLSALPARGATE